MSNPLEIIGSFMNNELKFGENQNVDLSTIEDGSYNPYGSLGDKVKDINPAEIRSYSEKGFIEYDSFSLLPARSQIHWQQPSYTILVKKAMFSSLADNFNTDYMDEGERLFHKSIKTLFANKCQVISAYEKLTKAANIIDTTNQMDKGLFSIISESINVLASVFPDNGTIASVKSVKDRLAKLVTYNTASHFTNWTIDETSFAPILGTGTGVIELTNVNNFRTSISLTGGNASFSIVDPYNLCTITIADIEKAISDAGNPLTNNKFLATLGGISNDLIQKNIDELNTLRRDRQASAIEIKTNPGTIFGKRLRIIIDRIGIEVPFSVEALSSASIDNGFKIVNGDSVVGQDGFQGREIYLIEKIIKDTFNKMSFDTTTKSNKTFGPADGDEDTPANYVRRKMMFWFLSRSIIDVNDVVYIYVNSRSGLDPKISTLRENFTRLGFMQNIANSVENIKETFNNIAGMFGAGGQNYDIEKSIFAGPDFPNTIWTMFREQFVSEKQGIQIFCGPVSGADMSYSATSGYTVSVSVADNMKYLSYGQINYQPSVDVFNGSINEQLTPFKSKFDQNVFSKDYELNDLLDENKKILTQHSKEIKIPSGPQEGRPADFNNLFGDVYLDNQQRINRVMFAPNGFVYRWKEGIGTLTQFGKFEDLLEPERIGTPNIADNPFSGQDVMNTLSLLICGVPYNYSNYLKSVRNYDTSGGSQKSFADKFRTDLRKSNRIYGNFIPFKNFTSNEQTYRNILLKQSYIDTANERVNSLTQQIAELSGPLALTPENSAQKQILNQRIIDLTTEANNLISEAEAQANKIVDQDIFSMLDLSEVSGLDSNNTDEAKKIRRKKTQFLTRRLSYNVRANEDKNYLIIDDSYDQDYDIASFENKLGSNISLFDSAYLTPEEKIKSVANLLDLEVFANSQGHIIIRPPQYNKIPSSVFNRMMQLKERTGLRIFPKFLEDLFGLQLQTVSSKVESIEDRIRLAVALLGSDYNSDETVSQFIQTNSGVIASTKRNNFQFLTDKNGILLNIDQIKNVMSIRDIYNNTGFQDIQQQTYTANQLGLSAKVQLVQNLSGSNNPMSVTPSDGTFIAKTMERLKNRGEFFDAQEYTNTIGQVGTSTSFINVPKVLSEIDSLLKQREKTVSILHYSLKNLIESQTIDGKNSDDVIPLFTQPKMIPEVYAGLIEDETYDDMGPGSGKRFIISDDKIISLSIKCNEPEFTAVTVTGTYDYIGNGGSIGGSVGQGGNALVSATSVDYDMWRRFGARKTSNVNVPYLVNPETQCAPFSISLLNKVRKSLITANLNVIANEFYQVGDVVFIESYNKLFYVSSVSHDYTEGSNFTTSLSLTYGHTPGEYIPTILDVVGKLLIKNKESQSFINFRQQQSDEYKPYGVFIIDASTQTLNFSFDSSSNTTASAKNNVDLITNLLYDANLIIDKYKTSSSKMRAKIEIRCYGKFGEGVNTYVKQAANSFKEALTQGFNNAPPIDKDDINVELVLLGDKEIRSPSQKAMAVTRQAYAAKTSTGLLETLYNTVLDVYIKFEDTNVS